MVRLKTRIRKPKKEKLKCVGGPFNEKTILLTLPHVVSGVFRVGTWTGFYKKSSLYSPQARWVDVSL